MGLAPLLSSHALWQAFHIAWVLSLLVLPPLPKPQIQKSSPPWESRHFPLQLPSRAPGLAGSLESSRLM